MRIYKGMTFEIIKMNVIGSPELEDFPFVVNTNCKYNSIYDLSYIYRLYIKKLYENRERINI